jgi:hypothetical protein
MYGVTSGFIYSISLSARILPFKHESDWSVCLTNNILDKGWLLSSAYKINYSQPCIKRSPLGQRNCNLLKVAQFIWNILWQITKMWLLNTGDRSIEVTASTGLINLKKSNNIWLHCLKNIKPKITGTFSLFSYWKQFEKYILCKLFLV